MLYLIWKYLKGWGGDFDESSSGFVYFVDLVVGGVFYDCEYMSFINFVYIMVW